MIRLFRSPGLLPAVLVYLCFTYPISLHAVVPADEKSVHFCDTQGYKIPFAKEKTIALYPTRESYLSKVNGMVDSMVKGKYLTKADGEKVKRETERVSAW